MPDLTEEDVAYIAARKAEGTEFASDLTHEDVQFFRESDGLVMIELPSGHFKGMLSDPNSFRPSGEYEDGDAP